MFFSDELRHQNTPAPSAVRCFHPTSRLASPHLHRCVCQLHWGVHKRAATQTTHRGLKKWRTANRSGILISSLTALLSLQLSHTPALTTLHWLSHAEPPLPSSHAHHGRLHWPHLPIFISTSCSRASTTPVSSCRHLC